MFKSIKIMAEMVLTEVLEHRKFRNYHKKRFRMLKKNFCGVFTAKNAKPGQPRHPRQPGRDGAVPDDLVTDVSGVPFTQGLEDG